ncbi:Uncharacterized protein YR821_1771 [Yersinia ruckeri]|uniref:Uncharacterized protein n=1 Tax=Yersinia ruckeri TaxID=29486 RepID=A0A0A8VDE2_YERRU|nr:hypothetical protein yruck0001_12950 [Yersinia ruckeri ATCC 29473]QTD76693.1 Uncharacterized protein YR821_1771 [Yersinia ruckeri]CEK27590.1 hypothetical protein CSF007_9185 [Yersinia ruckeri]
MGISSAFSLGLTLSIGETRVGKKSVGNSDVKIRESMVSACNRLYKLTH